MKKLAILLSITFAFLALTALTACDKKTDESASVAADANPAADTKAEEENTGIVGQWKHEMGYTYDFKADGTGAYLIPDGDPMKFTYTAENGKLSLSYEDTTQPTVLDYEIKGKVLNVKDSFGSDTLYNRI